MALVKFHIKSHSTTRIFGLQDQLNSTPDLLTRLLQFILNFILFSDFSSDLVEVSKFCDMINPIL